MTAKGCVVESHQMNYFLVEGVFHINGVSDGEVTY